MRKRLVKISLISLLVLFLFTPLYTLAASGDLDYVTDSAGLLTEDEQMELNIKAEEASYRYNCDIIIVTVKDIGDSHIEEYAQAVYDQYNLGFGEDKSGVMLIISMAKRDYDIMAHGYGNVAFTDHGKEMLAEKFLSDLSKGDYYNSFYTFIETCESYLESARVGEPIDIGIQQTKEGNSSGKIILLLIPLIIALVTASVQKGKMKTAKIQQKAREYVTKEGLKLTGREDVFLYKNVVKTKRESDSDSGGTSVDSRGSSHSSGKF